MVGSRRAARQKRQQERHQQQVERMIEERMQMNRLARPAKSQLLADAVRKANADIAKGA